MSYYDIGVPCKLLPPCQGDRASLLAVFLCICTMYKLFFTSILRLALFKIWLEQHGLRSQAENGLYSCSSKTVQVIIIIIIIIMDKLTTLFRVMEPRTKLRFWCHCRRSALVYQWPPQKPISSFQLVSKWHIQISSNASSSATFKNLTWGKYLSSFTWSSC